MLSAPHPSVVFRRAADGAVFLHARDEVYFGLNPVAAHVCEPFTAGVVALER
jgi:hypothetical protein